MMRLCVILPCYNEERNIVNFVKTLIIELEKATIEFDICVVDDGSQDNSIERLAELADTRITIIQFSRNFGKDMAILAGLQENDADLFLVMDADGQHPPSLIHEMLSAQEQGYNVVNGVKRGYRAKGLLSRWMSKFFNRLFGTLSGLNLVDSSDYKLLDREAAAALRQCNDFGFFFRAMTKWVGFKQKDIIFDVSERQQGKSGWTRKRLFLYALNAILLYSYTPLNLLLLIGAGSFGFSILLGAKLFVDYLLGKTASGYATLLAVSLLAFSIIVLCTGIIGLYLQKILDQVKGRPRYIFRRPK